MADFSVGDRVTIDPCKLDYRANGVITSIGYFYYVELFKPHMFWGTSFPCNKEELILMVEDVCSNCLPEKIYNVNGRCDNCGGTDWVENGN